MDSKIAVIIVNHNARDELGECLRSVFEETPGVPLDIYVVDNGSDDGSAGMVERRFPSVRLIINERNLGFSRANNIALRRILGAGDCESAVLLNSDTVVLDKALIRLAEYLEANPGVGAVGPALFLPDGRRQTGAGGYLPSAITAFQYFFFLFKLFPRHAKGLFFDQFRLAGSRERLDVDWLSGACLMLTIEAIRTIGFLDEKYFFYGEDIDWGRRMKAAGIRLHYLPWIRVVHHHGLSMRNSGRDADTSWLRAIFDYVRRERGGLEYGLFRLFAVLGFSLRLVLYGAGYPFSRKEKASRRSKIREISSYLVFSLTKRIAP